MEVLRATFKPEFLNRIDDVIIFRALTMEDIGSIVNIQTGLMAKRLRDKGMDLELTERAKKYIAEAGYNPTYGARPLKRALQKIVEDNLAVQILEGVFAEGDRIIADVDEAGKVTFRKRHRK